MVNINFHPDSAVFLFLSLSHITDSDSFSFLVKATVIITTKYIKQFNITNTLRILPLSDKTFWFVLQWIPMGGVEAAGVCLFTVQGGECHYHHYHWHWRTLTLTLSLCGRDPRRHCESALLKSLLLVGLWRNDPLLSSLYIFMVIIRSFKNKLWKTACCMSGIHHVGQKLMYEEKKKMASFFFLIQRNVK